jgi:UDP-glucose 4-epimerase
VNDEILIIGAGGFLGTALATKLVGSGRIVHSLLRQPIQPEGKLGKIHIGSMDDTQLLRTILPACNTAFLLASATTPGSSAVKPSMEAELNLLPTLRLIETMQDFPSVRMVFISSGGTLYGNPGLAHATEETPLNPLSYHGAGKLAIEAFLHTLHLSSCMDITILRPSNLYGPGQRLRSGFGLVRNVLECARRGESLTVWGDGESIRDYLYIDDMVKACEKVLAAKNPGWQIFNVGSGIGHSINQIHHLTQEITRLAIPVTYQPARAGDVRNIVLDCKKIRSELNWSAETKLAEGIRKTWNWLQTHAPTK